MWDIFGTKAKERAAKLEAQMQALLEKEQEREEKELEEQRKIEAEKAEEERQERLIKEEKERQEAEKTLATEKGEPWINVVSLEMDPDAGATVGAIEMDWNEHFIKMLHENGYTGVSDEDAVDQWFRDVCKHVVLETYEQADEGQKTNREDLGGGRAEYS